MINIELGPRAIAARKAALQNRCSTIQEQSDEDAASASGSRR